MSERTGPRVRGRGGGDDHRQRSVRRDPKRRCQGARGSRAAAVMPTVAGPVREISGQANPLRRKKECGAVVLSAALSRLFPQKAWKDPNAISSSGSGPSGPVRNAWAQRRMASSRAPTFEPSRRVRTTPMRSTWWHSSPSVTRSISVERPGRGRTATGISGNRATSAVRASRHHLILDPPATASRYDSPSSSGICPMSGFRGGPSDRPGPRAPGRSKNPRIVS